MECPWKYLKAGFYSIDINPTVKTVGCCESNPPLGGFYHQVRVVEIEWDSHMNGTWFDQPTTSVIGRLRII